MRKTINKTGSPILGPMMLIVVMLTVLTMMVFVNPIYAMSTSSSQSPSAASQEKFKVADMPGEIKARETFGNWLIGNGEFEATQDTTPPAPAPGGELNVSQAFTVFPVSAVISPNSTIDAATTTFRVVFSKNINEGKINREGFKIEPGFTSLNVSLVRFTGDTFDISLQPGQNLLPDTNYTLSIAAGAVEGMDGSAFDGYTLSFKTGSGSTPSPVIRVPEIIITTPPSNLTTGEFSDLQPTAEGLKFTFFFVPEIEEAGLFQELISLRNDDTNKNVLINKSVQGGDTIVIEVREPLDPDSNYRIHIGSAVSNKAGSLFPGKDFTFKTQPQAPPPPAPPIPGPPVPTPEPTPTPPPTPPTPIPGPTPSPIIGTDPPSNPETGELTQPQPTEGFSITVNYNVVGINLVATAENIRLTKEVAPQGKSIQQNGEVPVSTTIGSDGQSLVITAQQDLDPGTRYKLEVPDGAAEDLEGNPLPGKTFRFITEGEAPAPPPPAPPTGITATLVVGQKTLVVNGVVEEMDVAPFIKDGRAFVPVRYVAQAVGVSEDNIVWDPATQTLTLVKGDRTIQMTIGSTTMLINGAPVTMDTAPELVPPGRVMLPIRFVAEALGLDITYDDATKTVTIKSP